ncbi:MAG: hypothetical protein IJ686_00825 [Bacteroidales bacterium]|nr:hypothetical protein [Bacteroidales bacterium]
MKKYLSILLGAAIVLAAACSKEENGGKAKRPIKEGPFELSFDASIAPSSETVAPSSRLTYTVDGNTLKGSWKKNDQISLIAVDRYDQIISNDIFTAKSSAATATFTGTYTNDPNAVRVYVYFPAFSDGDGNGSWYSPKHPNDKYNQHGPFRISGGDLFMDPEFPVIQAAASPLNMLNYYSLMTGQVSLIQLKKGVIETTVNLTHSTFIIKADITVPSVNPDGDYDYWFKKVTASTNNTVYALSFAGTGSVGGTSYWGGFPDPQNSLTVNLAGINASGQPNGFMATRGTVLTVYFVGYRFMNPGTTFRPQLSNGDTFSISVEDQDEVHPYATMNVTATKVFLPGKMYRLSANLKYPQSEDPQAGTIVWDTGVSVGYENPFTDSETQL